MRKKDEKKRKKVLTKRGESANISKRSAAGGKTWQPKARKESQVNQAVRKKVEKNLKKVLDKAE